MKKLISLLSAGILASTPIISLSACSNNVPANPGDSKTDLSKDNIITPKIKEAANNLVADGVNDFTRLKSTSVNNKIFGQAKDITNLDVAFYEVNGTKRGAKITDLSAVLKDTSYFISIEALQKNPDFKGKLDDVKVTIKHDEKRYNLAKDNAIASKIIEANKTIYANETNTFDTVYNASITLTNFGGADKDIKNLEVNFYNTDAEGNKGDLITSRSIKIKVASYFISVKALDNNSSFYNSMKDLKLTFEAVPDQRIDLSKTDETTTQIKTNLIKQAQDQLAGGNIIGLFLSNLITSKVFGQSKDLNDLNISIYNTMDGKRTGNALDRSSYLMPQTYAISITSGPSNADFKGTLDDQIVVITIDNNFIAQYSTLFTSMSTMQGKLDQTLDKTTHYFHEIWNFNNTKLAEVINTKSPAIIAYAKVFFSSLITKEVLTTYDEGSTWYSLGKKDDAWTFNERSGWNFKTIYSIGNQDFSIICYSHL